MGCGAVFAHVCRGHRHLRARNFGLAAEERCSFGFLGTLDLWNLVLQCIRKLGTVNARSLLPLIPAVGILIARRLDARQRSQSFEKYILVIPLALSGLVAVWVTWSDYLLANSARDAALYVREHVHLEAAKVSFSGHWGFQYYMQELGFSPVDSANYDVQDGNAIVVPQNNTNPLKIPPPMIASSDSVEFPIDTGVSTMSSPAGSGFYAEVWGSLPYAFGPAPPENT